MEKLDHNFLFVTMGVVAIVLELLLGAPTKFELLILGIIFLVGGIIGSVTGNLLYAGGFIIILSALAIFIVRKIIKNRMHLNVQKQ